MQHASTSTTLAEDAAVRSTDTDALVSRCAAASLDYLDDKLSPLFLAPNQRRNLDRRPPLINIGTHARTYALDRLVADFLLLDHHQVGHQPARQCQVVSLGAGTDSRFWRIRTLFDQQGRDWPCKHWVEVDFPEATSAKARTVASKPVLRDALGGNVKIGASPSLLPSCRRRRLSADSVPRPQNSAAKACRRPCTRSSRATSGPSTPSPRPSSPPPRIPPPPQSRPNLSRQLDPHPSPPPSRPSSSSSASSSTSRPPPPTPSLPGSRARGAHAEERAAAARRERRRREARSSCTTRSGSTTSLARS